MAPGMHGESDGPRHSCRIVRTGLLWVYIIPVWALASGACVGEAPTNTVTVRDSAGIEIVESAERQWPEDQGWTVDPMPVLDLARSGTGEAHEFFSVTSATRLPDGGIAVAMRTEIRLFSPSGSHLSTWGRRGEGPGEFGYLSLIKLLEPDSLAAFDRRLGRVTIFGADGVVGRIVRPEETDLRLDRAVLMGDEFVFMTLAGALVENDTPWEEGLVRDPVSILAFSSSGQIRDTIGVAAGWESFRFPVEDGWVDGQAFLGRDSYLAAHGASVLVGDGVDFEYRVLSAAGGIERIVRGAKDLSLSQDRLDSERAAFLGGDPSPLVRRLLDRQPVPDQLPAYSNLLIDATGSVWLEEYRGRMPYEESLNPRRWDVFGPDGAWLGQVSFPGRFSVFEIGEEYVLGVSKDELDVESVQLVAVQR